MGERENVDGGGNERGQVELKLLLSKKLPGMKGSKTVKVRSGCNLLNCVVVHPWGASEDGKLVEESLGSDVRDEVENEQQDVM